jgi:DNA-directed RNA polymerase subunit F
VRVALSQSLSFTAYAAHFHYFFPYAVLSNAQVAVILQMSKGNAVNRDEELNEVYRKTLKYVMRFNTMSNPEKQNQEVVDELDNLQEYVLVCCCIVTVC